MFIYVIRNSVTGKVYIGQHKGNSLKKYLQDKLSHAQKFKGRSILFNSMQKHPKEVWSIEPLMEVETKEELDRLEKLFITLYDTRNPEVGYNICKGGEGFTGPHSEEARIKIGKSQIGGSKPWAIGNKNSSKKRSPEVCKALSERRHSEETKAKIAQATRLQNNALTPEQRAERCALMRAARKKKQAS